jgi:hypothetical protein
MVSRFNVYRVVSIVFWIFAFVTAIVWVFSSSSSVVDPGWDLHVYEKAILSLRAGHDPYADGIAIQRIFHSTLAFHPQDPHPFTYVYSPITLPLLRWIGTFSPWLSGGIYWLVYAVSLPAAIWVGMQAVEAKEWRIFVLLAPAAVFFPGLLENDVLFSGNIAYVIYGLIFVTAVVGWRRGQWGWFYAAVLAASCCKAPMLSLLAIPVLSARRQWLPACLTGACGVALFAMQPLLWPSQFHNYLTAVELQFSFNRDFSCSPAGLLAGALYNVIPYPVTNTVFYFFYGIPVFGILLYLSRRFLAGYFSLKQWMPVLLVGVVLLNPRIMEYDVAAITVPMALIAWRLFARGNTLARTIFEMSLVLLVLQNRSAIDWRTSECLLLVGLFAAGSWNLFTLAPEAGYGSVDVPSARVPNEERVLVEAQM